MSDQSDSVEITNDNLPTPETEDVYATPYKAPRGYVLVEESQYRNLLKAQETLMNLSLRGPQTTSRSSERNSERESPPNEVIKLRMLRQMWLGDINTNLTPGDEIEFSPGNYIKVGGELHRKMKSFLAAFKIQYGPKVDEEVYQNPFFEILNPDICPDPHRVFGQTSISKSRFNTEEARIAYEEKSGDSARKRVNVPGDVHDQLQMRTAPSPRVDIEQANRSKAQIIHGMTADAIERPQGSNVGSQNEDSEPQTVEDFQITSRMAGGGKTVSAIPGPPADEGRASMAARKQGNRPRR
jgi:hypothetical protein